VTIEAKDFIVLTTNAETDCGSWQFTFTLETTNRGEYPFINVDNNNDKVTIGAKSERKVGNYMFKVDVSRSASVTGVVLPF